MAETGEGIGSGAATWSAQASLTMVKKYQVIKDFLTSKHRWEEFQLAIGQWRDEFLNNSPFGAEATANALFSICQNYDLMELLTENLTPRMREPVRTRGMSRTAATDLEQGLREMARVFT